MKGLCWTFESFGSRIHIRKRFVHFKEFLDGFQRKKKSTSRETFEKRATCHLRIRTLSVAASATCETNVLKLKYKVKVESPLSEQRRD